MKKYPLISVIIPVYQVEKFLRRCIDSIINQTYRNLEIILINDGSSDNSGKICDEYSTIDFRIKVIHQENKGLSGARNRGVEIAKGEYIAFVDSDDWINNNMYEVLSNKMQDFDLDMVRCAAVETDGNKYEEIHPKKQNINKLFIGDEIFELYFSEFCCKVVWNALYKAHIVKGILSPERCHSQDNYVSGRYLYNCRKMMIIDEILYNYWVNPDSITTSGNRRNFDVCICTNTLLNDLLEIGMKREDFIRKLHEKLARELYHFIIVPDKRYRVIFIRKSLVLYIGSFLGIRRKISFFYKIWRDNIKII